MIAIVDYGMGNVRSVLNAFEVIGADAHVTADPAALDDATHVVLPGVGAFGDAMAALHQRQLIAPLERQALVRRKPFLGICLGMQLLAKRSTEHGLTEGLGWFDADVERFELATGRLNVPHMGWNDIEPARPHPLFAGLRPAEFTFYFVHSYRMICRDPGEVAAACDYGGPFVAAIARDNIFAAQFHPEKSQDSGLQILKNFVEWRA
jgi:glutamine amidotransferase